MVLPQLLRLYGQYDTAESIDKELTGSLQTGCGLAPHSTDLTEAKMRLGKVCTL